MSKESLKHKTKIGLYWKFFEQFSIYGMQFLVGIVMARLLSPSDFGITALPAVFMAIAQVFIDGSFGLALIRKPDLTEDDLTTSFYYSIAVGVLSYICLFIAAPLIADFYKVPILAPLVRVSALTFIWNPLNTPQDVILKRKLDFKTPARISLINKVFSAVLGILVAYCGYGVWALVVSSLSASMLGTIQMWWAVRWIPKGHFSINSFRYLWNFGNKMMGVGLMNAIYSNIIPVLVGKAYGTNDLGLLNRARAFASPLSSNLTGVINTVTFPVLSKFCNDDELLSANYRKMIKVSSFVVFPVMLLISALAFPLVVTLVTERWIGCVLLLQIMCFTYMFQPVQILNLNLLQVKGRTDLTFRLELFKKIVFTIAILVAIQYGLVVLCITDFFLTMIALFLNTYYTGKLLGLGYVKQIRDLAPSFMLSISMMVLVLFVTTMIENLILQLFIGGTLGILFYFGVAYYLKFSELNEVKYMLSRKA